MPPKCGPSRLCANCGIKFYKRYRDSTTQWEGRTYCSYTCSNRATAVRHPMEVRFWKYVVKTHRGCWGWSGGTDTNGYGVIGAEAPSKSKERAHRVSWMVHFGDIFPSLEIMHLCDNPECCNPHHLAMGSHQANMFDCGRKGRVHQNSLNNLKGTKK